MCRLVYLFFQAEDGIRDVERSRGLGDVYKRQEQVCYFDFRLCGKKKKRMHCGNIPIQVMKMNDMNFRNISKISYCYINFTISTEKI